MIHTRRPEPRALGHCPKSRSGIPLLSPLLPMGEGRVGRDTRTENAPIRAGARSRFGFDVLDRRLEPSMA